eukprot:528304-Prymnesium_polylepis.1
MDHAHVLCAHGRPPVQPAGRATARHRRLARRVRPGRAHESRLQRIPGFVRLGCCRKMQPVLVAAGRG